MESNLIQVVQLPIIVEQLQTMKADIQREVDEALSLVCTEDTVNAVKNKRAELNKLYKDLEERRKSVKDAVMGPYNDFEAVYKDCVTNALRDADAALKSKIDDVEIEIKSKCENALRDYFAELCAVHHLDWLTYEQAGIKVDMASAKAKTPKKLREQLDAFVGGVADSVAMISSMDDADEIMVEYKQTLDAAGSIFIVQDRHRRIEEQKAAQETRKAAQERDADMVRRVEALAPPVIAEAPEPVVKCTFTVRATKEQLRKLKEFLNMEGIKYE